MSTVKKIHIYYRILPTNVPLKVTICSHFKCVNVNQIFRLSKFKKSMKHSQYSTNPKVVGSTLSICYPAIMSLSKTPNPQFLLNGKTILELSMVSKSPLTKLFNFWLQIVTLHLWGRFDCSQCVFPGSKSRVSDDIGRTLAKIMRNIYAYICISLCTVF